jgi:hypothetical protein
MSDIARQQWLRDIADSLAPEFAAHGKPLPQNIRLTVGFPSTGGTRQRTPRVVGEIHDASRSDDNHFEIFISPVNADSVTVAAVLAHELVHAAVGIHNGHNADFGALARAIGLDGKLTATVASPAFEQKIRNWTAAIGEYPHATLNVTGITKQTTRLIKYVCPVCHATIRASQTAFNAGLFKCGVHDVTLVRG